MTRTPSREPTATELRLLLESREQFHRHLAGRGNVDQGA